MGGARQSSIPEEDFNGSFGGEGDLQNGRAGGIMGRSDSRAVVKATDLGDGNPKIK